MQLRVIMGLRTMGLRAGPLGLGRASRGKVSVECISGTREGRTVVVRVEHGRTEHVAGVVRAEAQAAAHVHALVQRDRSDLVWGRGLGLGLRLGLGLGPGQGLG